MRCVCTLCLHDALPILVALFIVYGGFTALTDGVGKAWVSAVTPAEARGRGQGLYQGLTGGAVLVAGLWAGLAWQAGPGERKSTRLNSSHSSTSYALLWS